MPLLTIVISYYKALGNLKLILLGLNEQSNKSFEVIISEDDNNPETVEFLLNEKRNFNFPIHHIHQDKDSGFRKNMMLNKAIKLAQGETIAFIDGDCIPHKHLVREYIKQSLQGYFLSGRRVMLSESLSANLLKTASLKKLNLYNLIICKSGALKEAIYFPFFHLSVKTRGLLGCNWAARKEDLLLVNGFDEDYVKPGVGEDMDIEWRLQAHGIKNKSVKNKAIVYHLYHPRSYSEDGVMHNLQLLKTKQDAGLIKCINGLVQLH